MLKSFRSWKPSLVNDSISLLSISCLIFRISSFVSRLSRLSFSTIVNYIRISSFAPRLSRLSFSKTVNYISYSSDSDQMLILFFRSYLAFRAFASISRLIQFDYRILQQFNSDYVISLLDLVKSFSSYQVSLWVKYQLSSKFRSYSFISRSFILLHLVITFVLSLRLALLFSSIFSIFAYNIFKNSSFL